MYIVIHVIIILVIRACLTVNLELRHGKLISSLTIRLKGTQLPKKVRHPKMRGDDRKSTTPILDSGNFWQNDQNSIEIVY